MSGILSSPGILANRPKLGGFLSNLGKIDNRLLGFASGIFGGQGPSAIGQGFQGWMAGGQMDQQEAEQLRLEQERQQQEQALSGAYSNMDLSPELLGLYEAFPELGGQAAADFYTPDAAPAPDDLMTVAAGSNIYDPNTGGWIAPPQSPPSAAEAPADWQLYQLSVQQYHDAGMEPPTYDEWDLARKGREGGIDPTVAEQRYALLYQNAARELPIIEQTFGALTELGNQAANQLPDILGNWLVSPDYQRALSAMTQIVQMQTYALTGAAATESEAARIARTLLPAIGDQPPVLADKLQRVYDAVESIRMAAGPAGSAFGPTQAAPPPTMGGGSAGAASVAPVQINSVSEYALLPPGTEYIDPNGVHRVKGQ